MQTISLRSSGTRLSLFLSAGFMLLRVAIGGADPVTAPPASSIKDDFASVQLSLKKYCLDCHSTKRQKGSLDLERFAAIDDVRKDIKPWQHMIELVEAGEMPPKDQAQPSPEEKKQLIGWIRNFLKAEAEARAGDPGYIPLRRLSNAEYDYTIRDLTGIDLHPTREFPADGAAGEGFTNAAEALTDISPALLTKYLQAAKEISEHVVLLPDGMQFSPNKTRRDWTNESLAELRKFYSAYPPDGRLPLQTYLTATIRYRTALAEKAITIAEVAAKEKLSPKYLGILWQTLTDSSASPPLDSIRAHWRKAIEKDIGALVSEISAWQSALWKVVAIGSYRNDQRQLANYPTATESQTLRLAVKPSPGQSEVILYLQNRELIPDNKTAQALWHRPRFEAPGKPTLLLKDYAQFGPKYEVDYSQVFHDSAKYLTAASVHGRDPKQSVEVLANRGALNPALLKRWAEVLALEPEKKESLDFESIGKAIPVVALEMLNEKIKNDKTPAVQGWVHKGQELPILLTNASDQVELIPGKVAAHQVVVHPSVKEFVAAAWKSPISGRIDVSGIVRHVHPACGNGVAWSLRVQRDKQARLIDEGAVDLGREAKLAAKTLKVEKGDRLILAIDARDANHICDLTQIDCSIREIEAPGRTWKLSEDVADTILDGNPHADKQGNKEVWSFVKGPSRPAAKTSEPIIPADSVLGRWRDSVRTDKSDTSQLAEQVQALLTGPRPAKEKDPNRILYDHFVTSESALLTGLDLSSYRKVRKPSESPLGLEQARFGHYPDGNTAEAASFGVGADSITEIRVPAPLFRDYEFVVEGKSSGNGVAHFQVSTSTPASSYRWDGKSQVVAAPQSKGYQQLLQGYEAFRKCFPLFICFPHVLPEDEVVCLKMYHREDEPLTRLFLDESGQRRIDHLWQKHRFISQQPVAENNYLPQFIGYVTQDSPKEVLVYFEGQRPAFRQRADDFEKDVEAAIPKQLDALLEFAARAYRRPLADKEKSDLRNLYQTIRNKGVRHDEAFRGVLARILVAPAYLFRIEHAPAGKEAGPVNDWELATRLSYFLWSSAPDDQLRQLAAAGKLHEPQIFAEQAQRMLKDERIRALAVEFGTQWLHVRGFDEFNEKNEKLFPTFDAGLRQAINEESIRFFQDLFQQDRSIGQILDGDATYLNELLARHYGIPGVVGPEFRRVEGIKKHGRGGILGLASVQAKNSGASRTSPVLRGNWVVETLLGEKLPRPPASVPKLPEEEGGTSQLTVRRQVEKHAMRAECSICHQRIDPYGFALEQFDTIGRRRDKDLGGLAIDAQAKLKDGTTFQGLDGLRGYLLTKKKDVFDRLFCRKLLGYALGRAVTLSDQALIEEMMRQLNQKDGHLSAAVMAIVQSPQFRRIRGGDFEE